MIIGVPREIMHGEKRVSVVPETVSKLKDEGFSVLIEKGAGADALFRDEEYAASGAQIIEDVEELYRKSDVVLKVKEPQFNTARNLHEIDMMHEGQYLITFIHPASPANHEMVGKMAEKGITGLTLDGIPRISRAQKMDALTSMSTCAGYKGILIAVDHLARFVPQIFCAVGMIKPCNIMITGAGVAGLQAIATAKRLGAVTHAADIRPDAAEQARSLGARTIDTGVPAEVAVGEGGYANALDEKWLDRERENLGKAVSQMDVVFCSALIPGRKAPVLITEDMVKSMREGSVIVDVSIDQGGNCEITEAGKTVVKHGVTIEGIKNIPGMLAESSTWMFANNVYNFISYISENGVVSLDRGDEIIEGVLTTIDGEIVHKGTLEAMGVR